MSGAGQDFNDILKRVEGILAPRELDMESPAAKELLTKRKQEIAKALDAKPHEQGSEHLVFKVGGALYAVPVTAVQGIVHPIVTTFPGTPAWLVGAFNHRGTVYALLDAQVLLGRREAGLRDRTTAIVVSAGGSTVGLLVDEAVATATFAESAAGPGARRITDEGIAIIDPAFLLEGVSTASVDGRQKT